ncbi:hypothetical protein KIPB_005479, partial [Kipferlia bialata]
IETRACVPISQITGGMTKPEGGAALAIAVEPEAEAGCPDIPCPAVSPMAEGQGEEVHGETEAVVEAETGVEAVGEAASPAPEESASLVDFGSDPVPQSEGVSLVDMEPSPSPSPSPETGASLIDMDEGGSGSPSLVDLDPVETQPQTQAPVSMIEFGEEPVAMVDFGSESPSVKPQSASASASVSEVSQTRSPPSNPATFGSVLYSDMAAIREQLDDLIED